MAGDQTMLRSLKSLLEPHVEVSAMTDNALALVDAVESLEPDLAIVHMTIPERMHMNMTRHLKSRLPGLKMIVVSDHTDSVVVCDVLNQGVQDYVFQHNAKTELLPAVEEVLREDTNVASIEGQEGEHGGQPISREGARGHRANMTPIVSSRSRLRVESQPGQGTMIQVRLPLTRRNR